MVKLNKLFLVIFYVASFIGIVLQSIPSFQNFFGENVFEVRNERSNIIGFSSSLGRDVSETIMVDYNGASFHGLFIERFSLTNETGRNIRSSDFDSDIYLLVVNNSEAKVLSVESIDASGNKNKYLFDEGKEALMSVFKPHLINDGESLYVEIVSSMAPARVKFKSRIAGVEGFVDVYGVDFNYYVNVFVLGSSVLIMCLCCFLIDVCRIKAVSEVSSRLSNFIGLCGMVGVFAGIEVYGKTFYYFFNSGDRILYFAGAFAAFFPYFIVRVYSKVKGRDVFAEWIVMDNKERALGSGGGLAGESET